MEIRDLRPDETDFLRETLYTALAWRPDVELPPREQGLARISLSVDPDNPAKAALLPPWLRRSRAGDENGRMVIELK